MTSQVTREDLEHSCSISMLPQDDLDFRWPSSVELELEEFTTKIRDHSFEQKKEEVQRYVEENASRLNINKLRKRNVCGKSLKDAMDWKKKGNDHFQRKRIKESLECYSQLVLTSPRGSEELSFGYANRSAALFHLDHFSDAIEDATRAIESNEYPKEKKYKILQRRGLCYMAEKRWKEAISDFQKASEQCGDDKERDAIKKNLEKATSGLKEDTTQPTDPSSKTNKKNNYLSPPRLHTDIANASASLDLQLSTVVGRHFVASSPIPHGEIIISEDPYAAVLLRDHENERCHHCFKVTRAFVPCNRCCVARFCSKKCVDYSKCGSAFYQKAPTQLILTLRIVARRNFQRQIGVERDDDGDSDGSSVGDSIPGTDESGRFNADYRSVQSLLPHFDEFPLIDLLDNLFNASMAVLCLRESGENSWEFDGILHHLCQLRTNVHAITEMVDEPERKDSVKQYRQKRIAEALYVTSSLLNHSCSPNTLVAYEGRKIVIRSTEDIVEGAEVSHCYGPHAGHMGYKGRQFHLKKQYFFDCQREDTGGFNCPNRCGIQLQEMNGWTNDKSDRLQCRRCKITVPVRKLEEDEEMADQYFDKAREYKERQEIDTAIQWYRKCLEKRNKLYTKFHLKIGEVNDAIGEIHASRKEWKAAAEHVAKAIEVNERNFGEDSPELGHEYAKIASIYYNDEQFVLSIENAEKSRNILSKHYKKDGHEVLREMEELRAHLLDFFEKTVGPYWST
ncbi:SET and MYND domain-containing protein 4-like [Planoprotostelium fungivorum]|uniref:SET and MYND domain-containing protein 4-like n=1 Tax=Planoprotostelium fungivorum TaxID=1890364 RepID=A0A2P6MPB8_9EUKA|nr:SET and MYND domain-containing protein 4-like [Planoprotostelium fungivorum]